MSRPQDRLDVAIAWHQQYRLEEAEKIYREILAQDPNHPDALHLLGVIADQVGHHEQAVRLIGRAISLGAESPLCYTNLAGAWRALARFDEARAAYLRAIELDPKLVEPFNNLGTVCHGQGRLDEAVTWFERALELQGDFADAHYNRALAWLAQGDFRRGWPEYEWRFGRKEFYLPPIAQPEWEGSPLAGRRLLVRAEQGLGDVIQFARYLPILQSCGAHVQFSVPSALTPLLRQSGIGPLVPDDEVPAPFDVHVPLLSVPARLGTTLESIPANVPYLSADESLVRLWRERLPDVHGCRVGIAWQGSPKHPQDAWRSMPLVEFAPLAKVPGVRLVCLQKGLGLEQLDLVRGAFDVLDLRPEVDVQEGAFLNAAAIMLSLDLVITVDSAIAHLAGALGVRTWVLLGTSPDYRWLMDRDDNPWYPTVRLFRQARHNDWSEVMARVAGELAVEVNSRRQLG